MHQFKLVKKKKNKHPTLKMELERHVHCPQSLGRKKPHSGAARGWKANHRKKKHIRDKPKLVSQGSGEEFGMSARARSSKKGPFLNRNRSHNYPIFGRRETTFKTNERNEKKRSGKRFPNARETAVN